MIITEEKQKQQQAAVQAMVETDRLVPEYLFHDVYASQVTFTRWKQDGLKTHKVGRLCFIRPSELEEFLIHCALGRGFCLQDE